MLHSFKSSQVKSSQVKSIIILAICVAFNISSSQAIASTTQQGANYHLSSHGIIVAKEDGDWKAVGDGAGLQNALGMGKPEDVEERKQAAEQAVQEKLEQERQEQQSNDSDDSDDSGDSGDSGDFE